MHWAKLMFSREYLALLFFMHSVLFFFFLPTCTVKLPETGVIHSAYREPHGHHIHSVAGEDDLMGGHKTMTSVHVAT